MKKILVMMFLWIPGLSNASEIIETIELLGLPFNDFQYIWENNYCRSGDYFSITKENFEDESLLAFKGVKSLFWREKKDNDKGITISQGPLCVEIESYLYHENFDAKLPHEFKSRDIKYIENYGYSSLILWFIARNDYFSISNFQGEMDYYTQYLFDSGLFRMVKSESIFNDTASITVEGILTEKGSLVQSSVRQ